MKDVETFSDNIKLQLLIHFVNAIIVRVLYHYYELNHQYSNVKGRIQDKWVECVFFNNI